MTPREKAAQQWDNLLTAAVWIGMSYDTPGFLERVLELCDDYLADSDEKAGKVPCDDLGILTMRQVRKWVQGRIMDRDW